MKITFPMILGGLAIWFFAKSSTRAEAGPAAAPLLPAEPFIVPEGMAVAEYLEQQAALPE